MSILHFEIHIMSKPFIQGAGCTCNGFIFLYQGHKQFLYLYIAIASALAIYLLYKTLRLCNIAFSYSNFHVHETYKLYALAFINLAFIILSRWSQLDYQNFYEKYNDPTQYDLKVIGRGYEIVNDLFGIFSIFTNNFMHIYNSFTWLNIAFSCDYNLAKNPSIVRNSEVDQTQLSEHDEQSFQNNKERVRKIIKYAKFIVNYCLAFGMLILTVLGTFFYGQKLNSDGQEVIADQNKSWCLLATVMTIVATSFPLVLFGIAFFFYAKHLWDPQVSKITKAGLVYLLITMLVRLIYFVIAKLNEHNIDKNSEPSGDLLSLAYTVLFTLLPIVVMSILGEKQLQKEQYTLLRRSSLIFKSTIL